MSKAVSERVAGSWGIDDFYRRAVDRPFFALLRAYRRLQDDPWYSAHDARSFIRFNALNTLFQAMMRVNAAAAQARDRQEEKKW